MRQRTVVNRLLALCLLVCLIGATPSPTPFVIELKTVTHEDKALVRPLNGSWWQHLRNGEKAVAVQSLIEGTHYSYGVTLYEVMRTVTPSQPENAADVTSSEPIFSKSVATYVRRIDRFYATRDHRYTVALIVGCLADRPFPQTVCNYLKIR